MVVKGDRVELVIDDFPTRLILSFFVSEPMPPGARVSTDCEPNRIYSVGDSDLHSSETKAIFGHDQWVRQAQPVAWRIVERTDVEQRAWTRK